METPNLSYIKELSGGDKSFEKKLIGIIKKEFPGEKEIYYKNFELKKFKLTADCVHKLKHKISIFGLEESYELASCYESDLRKDDVSRWNDFEIILENITNYLIRI